LTCKLLLLICDICVCSLQSIALVAVAGVIALLKQLRAERNVNHDILLFPFLWIYKFLAVYTRTAVKLTLLKAVTICTGISEISKECIYTLI